MPRFYYSTQRLRLHLKYLSLHCQMRATMPVVNNASDVSNLNVKRVSFALQSGHWQFDFVNDAV